MSKRSTSSTTFGVSKREFYHTDKNPGPGQYKNPSTFRRSKSAAIFNSTGPKARSMTIHKSHAVKLKAGPGDYETSNY